MTGGKKLFRLLLKIFSGILSLALIVTACLSLILAHPQADSAGAPEPQPSLTPSPAVSAASEYDLRSLVSSFPVPVMSFISGTGMTFVSGSSRDVAFDGGSGRIATLNWKTRDGDPVILQSIYPASALSLLDSGYHFSNKLGPVLFGSESVRMESAQAVRLHACTESALYVVIVPPAAAPSLSALSQSLQLISPQ